MHSQVRDLYKRMLFVGRDYPHPNGLQYMRDKLKKGFLNNKELDIGSMSYKKAIHHGR